jgi:hypothetical protein
MVNLRNDFLAGLRLQGLASGASLAGPRLQGLASKAMRARVWSIFRCCTRK